MCGLAGFIDRHFVKDAESCLRAMGDAIAYRGPDDSGLYHERESGIGFVHRRLSIVDLSAAGHQPMLSSSGRFIIVFNGEIYNHADLRQELEKAGHGLQWRGHSDT